MLRRSYDNHFWATQYYPKRNSLTATALIWSAEVTSGDLRWVLVGFKTHLRFMCWNALFSFRHGSLRSAHSACCCESIKCPQPHFAVNEKHSAEPLCWSFLMSFIKITEHSALKAPVLLPHLFPCIQQSFHYHKHVLMDSLVSCRLIKCLPYIWGWH